MGRPLSSCFKIISCSGDSSSNDDPLLPMESKPSFGKLRWSFQKRSSTHNEPCNNATSEPSPTGNNEQKKEADTDTVNTVNRTVADETNEISILPLAAVPSRGLEQVTDKPNIKLDHNVTEEVVLVVQASIRGYLAKRDLERCKEFVKIQASIRRFLVMKWAVGTLRCILAIVRMQQIVRRRLATPYTKPSAMENLKEEEAGVKVKSFDLKSNKESLAIKSLTSNAFASQLLKSTLKTNPIHISCDPLKRDLGWIWLERWTTLTSSDWQKIILKQDDSEEVFNTNLDVYEVNNAKFQVLDEHISSDSNLSPGDPPLLAEATVDVTCSEKIEVDVPVYMQDQFSNSLAQDNQVDSYAVDIMSAEKDEHTASAIVGESPDHAQNLIYQPLDEVSEFELDGNSINPASFKEKLNETSLLEIDQVVIESMKPRSTGFASVQAMFEELSGASSSIRHLSHISMDTKSGSKSFQSQFCSNLDDSNESKSVALQAGTKFKDGQAENYTGHEISLNFTPDNSVVVLSHVSVPDSQGTPLSQVSSQTTKTENSIPVRKKRSRLLNSSSTTNSSNDTGVRTGGELMKKDTKSAERRNSFSMVKIDHIDPEHQSISSNILPSYMQPTESAKAKVNASISQKASPDMPSSDNHMKKRHSLPNGDGNEGSSPRMQRSTSQLQQNVKGNGTHSPHNSNDRRWLR